MRHYKYYHYLLAYCGVIILDVFGAKLEKSPLLLIIDLSSLSEDGVKSSYF